MHFDNSFSVPKPIDEVWATMLDLERVIPCVPDARVLEKTDDDKVTAEIKIRLGSMSMQYSGPAEIVERDDDAHRAVLSAQRQGGSRAGQREGEGRDPADRGRRAGPRPSFTRTSPSPGRAAAMGEGVIAGVTEAMINQFAENLAKI